MRRLTKSGVISQKDINELMEISNENQFNMNNAYYKLKHYEDLDEQGLLLRLPCKVGEKIYFVKFVCNSDYNICDVNCNSCADYVISEIKFELDMFDKINKFYFLTKEEAEQALRELKEE